MKMSKEKKMELLLKNFEIIKNNYEKNKEGIKDIVVKMFAIDIDVAEEIWLYLINRYEDNIKKFDSFYLTVGIANGGAEIIGEDAMDKIVLNTPELKNAFFSLMHEFTSIYDSNVIKRLISLNNLIVANELLELLFSNPYRADSWYSIMDNSLPWANNCEITQEAYELLEIWCGKVEDEEERAKLAIKMLDYFD